MKEMSAKSMSLFLLITFSSIGIAWNQQPEATGLHIDRNRYIAGENLWFSIYNTDASTGRLVSSSIVAYVELISPWKIPVIQKRIQLIEGRGSGTIVIPDTISSGNYMLRAYTGIMKDLMPDFGAMKEIAVYNPFKSSTFFRNINDPNNADHFPCVTPKELKETVKLFADTSFGTREKVSVKILAANTDGSPEQYCEMSVSVAPVSASDAFFQFSRNPGAAGSLSPGNPETRGHFLKMKARNIDSFTEQPERLFMSVRGKTAEFRYAEKDSSGSYIFTLPVDSKQKTYIVQPEVPAKNTRLEIESSFSWVMPETILLQDKLDKEEEEIFSGLSFNYQASRIYGTTNVKEAETGEQQGGFTRRFYGIPEMEVVLDDYIKLPDMTEVFFELLPGILLVEGKAGYEVKITNPLTGSFYEEPPLIMIDGVIINNLNTLVDLNPEVVDRIEVIKTPYLIGSLILHGIVNIITRTGDFSNVTMPAFSVMFPYRVVEPGYDFVSPDYSDPQSKMLRRPDLRNTLYWNPSLRTNSLGEAGFEFWTPDTPGHYLINLVGVSKSGRKVSACRSFVVKQ